MDANTWDNLIASLPQPHVLQTWEWGQVKARFGWQPYPLIWRDNQGGLQAAALVLRRSVSLGSLARWQVMYIPKGPLLRDWGDAALRRRVLEGLGDLARREGAIFIKIDPDVRLGTGVSGGSQASDDPLGQAVRDEWLAWGWRFSSEQVQFRNTVLVDLAASEEQLLARMKQKMRYNLRLAERKGVGVRIGSAADIPLLYEMYAETCVRDGFVIREQAYYRELWGSFFNVGLAEPLVAEVEGQPVAAVVVFRFGGRAWYMYGMSREAHREKMPNHLLQWRAMLRAKEAGCRGYDLWGAPDAFVESDPLWGVYRFKEGLGGEVVRHIGAWDLILRPTAYRLYTQLWQRLLELLRRRGRARTRQEIILN